MNFFQKIALPPEEGGGYIMLFPDGDYFEFDDDGDDAPPRPVCTPDEQKYAYSHGGHRYRAACEAIAHHQAEELTPPR